MLQMKPNIIKDKNQNQGMAKLIEIFPLKEEEITMEALINPIFIKIKIILKTIQINHQLLIKQLQKKIRVMALHIIDHKPEEIIMTIKIFKNIISGVNQLLKVMVLVENSKMVETIIMMMIFNMSVTGIKAFTKVTSNLTEIMGQMINKVIRLNHTINKKEIIKIIRQVMGLICIKQN